MSGLRTDSMCLMYGWSFFKSLSRLSMLRHSIEMFERETRVLSIIFIFGAYICIHGYFRICLEMSLGWIDG